MSLLEVAEEEEEAAAPFPSMGCFAQLLHACMHATQKGEQNEKKKIFKHFFFNWAGVLIDLFILCPKILYCTCSIFIFDFLKKITFE